MYDNFEGGEDAHLDAAYESRYEMPDDGYGYESDPEIWCDTEGVPGDLCECEPEQDYTGPVYCEMDSLD